MEMNMNQTPPAGSRPDGLTARREKLLSILTGNPNIQARQVSPSGDITCSG